MEMMCPMCGEIYEAKNRNKRYCSPRCRTAAHRMHAKTFEAFEEMENAPSPVGVVDAMNAIRRAHFAANDFYFLSNTGPYQLRSACLRIAEAITEALRREGFN